MNLLFILGTRPEAIKLAPVILEAGKRMINCSITSTGQHSDGEGTDIVEDILMEFGIRGDSLCRGIDRGDGSLGDTMAGMLDGLYRVQFDDETICFVQGDTASTVVGALWAFSKRIPVAHVEAGLRSGNKFSPYPEEVNRKLVAQIADYHFCPTEDNVINLMKEGVPKTTCHVTGNTVIDALKVVIDSNHRFKDDSINELFYNNKYRVVVMTMHRRENWGLLEDIFSSIKDVVSEYEDVKVVFPVHPNPFIQKLAHNCLRNSQNIMLVNPMGYVDFANLMARSYLLVTDSGGIQEEASYLNKFVLVVRRETERREGVTAGISKIVGVRPTDISNELHKKLSEDLRQMPFGDYNSIYGSGDAAKKIIDIITKNNLPF